MAGSREVKVDEFVIRRHDAKHAGLHHDLHLNGDTWAVPKLVPRTSGQRVLAIATTTHDPQQRRFEGTIPDGQYGAGTSKVEDEGELVVLERKSNHILFRLQGEIYRGVYHLRHWTALNWLLWKAA
jgi:bifunctional non-homologous end joining protein LigD